jgi:RNA-directed DNA polymerase
MLSNLASKNLDGCLEALAQRYGLIYTRYSDDIALSTGGDFTRAKALKLIVEVERIFFAFAHELNRKKITIAPPGARKLVLGLLVDGDKLKLPRHFRERVRDHVRGIQKFELASHARERNFASVWGMVRHIQGLLEYARAIDKTFCAPLQADLDLALQSQRFIKSN